MNGERPIFDLSEIVAEDDSTDRTDVPAPGKKRGRAKEAETAIVTPISPAHASEASAQTPADTEVDDLTPSRGGGLSWWLIAPASLLCLGWAGTMVWLSMPMLMTASPADITGFVAALCVPPALVGILLLLGLRTSRAEAQRFGATARAMRAEAQALEQTVAALTQRVNENRALITEQTSALTSLAEQSAARLATVGSGLSGEVRKADEHAAALAAAAEAAQTRLEVLLAQLPRAHGETTALIESIARTGLSASEQAAALDVQLVALAERGKEADAVASGAAQRLAAHIARMEATSETAGARLEAAAATMSEAVDGLLGRTADAVDEARKGISAQGDAMLAMLSTNQASLDKAGRDSAEALAERITAIEAVIDRIAARLDEQRGTGDTIITELETGLERVQGQMATLYDQGIDRTQKIAASVSALGSAADAMTEALKTGEAQATRTINTTEHLLTALDAAAREIDETLPEALARLDARINDSRKVVVEAKPELLALVTAAESTHDAIEAIAQVISAQRDTVTKLSGTLLETLTSGRTRADELGQMVDETIGQTHRFAEEAAPRLVEALIRVRDTAATAAGRARATLSDVIPEAAAELEAASTAAMERASARALQAQIAAISEAAENAAEAATRASERLTRQMLAIADATAVVESRIEDARTERENADRDTFARRVSLLIESLNSASIDITKAFAADVTDSAWAAYLKGDRGVFTRRAVRLLDTNEAREVLKHYDDDAAFREQVNRYIHDFEAMLRAVLAQRDGSPLGVTLLSSDMGKLYVALAQSIERLRA